MKSLILMTHYAAIDTKIPDNEIASGPTYRLFLELQKEGACVFERYQDLLITIEKQNRSVVTSGSLEIDGFDCIIPRSVNFFEYGLSYGHVAKLIAHIAKEKNIFVLNGNHLLSNPSDFNKTYQMLVLSQNGLPVPDTYFGNVHRMSDEKYPLIVKPLTGSKGRGVFKAENKTHLPDVSQEYLCQQVLPNSNDIRVLVLNGKCLGAMRRIAAKGMIASNFSLGATVEKIILSPEIEELSIAAAKAFSLDFCGVDLMFDSNQQLNILEINRFPSFIGFQKVTNINVSLEIVKFLKSQTSG